MHKITYCVHIFRTFTDLYTKNANDIVYGFSYYLHIYTQKWKKINMMKKT